MRSTRRFEAISMLECEFLNERRPLKTFVQAIENLSFGIDDLFIPVRVLKLWD